MRAFRLLESGTAFSRAFPQQLVVATAAVGAAGALMILGGCGSSRSPSGGANSTPRRVLTASQYAYVIDAGQPSSTSGRSYFSQANAVFQAEQALRARCMRSSGFRYIRDPEVSAGGTYTTFDPQPDGRPPRKQELLAEREKNGFGLYAAAIAAHRPAVDPDPDDRYLMTLPRPRRAAWLRAWWGGRDGGCLRIAQTELYGSPANASADVVIPATIRNSLIMRAGSDPSIVAVTARWSACMLHATGVHWANEGSLIGTLATRPEKVKRTWAFHALETNDAVASARCGYATGQAQVYAAVYVQEASHLPSGLDQLLQRALVGRSEAVARARRVLSRTWRPRR